MDDKDIKALIEGDVLTELFASETIVPEGLCGKFIKAQPAAIAAGEDGRVFTVTGPKADKIRKLIFSGLGFTRKQISMLVDCSVSRVGEVIWALEEDVRQGTIEEFPAVPLKAEPAKKDEVTA